MPRHTALGLILVHASGTVHLGNRLVPFDTSCMGILRKSYIYKDYNIIRHTRPLLIIFPPIAMRLLISSQSICHHALPMSHSIHGCLLCMPRYVCVLGKDVR